MVADGSGVLPRIVDAPHVILDGARLFKKLSPGLGRLRLGGDVEATLEKGLGKLAAKPEADDSAVLARCSNLLLGDVDKL